MKNILFLLTFCLFAFGCKDSTAPVVEIPEEEVPAPQIPEDTGCFNCPCPEWVEKEFASYTKQTPSAVPLLYYYMGEDGGLCFAIIDGFASPAISTLQLFDADGKKIGKEHKDYEVWNHLFAEGKFLYNFSCTHAYTVRPEEEISGCDDCPCPEWLDNIFKYYKEQTPVYFFPSVYYMEKDGIPYYAINNAAASCITCVLRFFEVDGTEIEKEQEKFEALKSLFAAGYFRYNHSCTFKYREK
ncbi:MAG: hypothetical protein LBB84_03200 [Tannerellaceae bacterium]|jgi:hypothetical protein|nr:hypothetical protein [Tannerellaceae bacterium]